MYVLIDKASLMVDHENIQLVKQYIHSNHSHSNTHRHSHKINVKRKNSSNRTYTGHEIAHLKILVLHSSKMTTKQVQQSIKILLDTLVPNSSD